MNAEWTVSAPAVCGISVRFWKFLPDSAPECLAEDDAEFDVDPMNRQETIELVKAYYKIPNRKAAKHMFDLIIAMSKTTYNNKDEDDKLK